VRQRRRRVEELGLLGFHGNCGRKKGRPDAAGSAGA
jgi:hypothetical protein